MRIYELVSQRTLLDIDLQGVHRTRLWSIISQMAASLPSYWP